MARKRRIVNNNDSKNYYIRGKDASIYLGALLAIIACMYNLFDSLLQAIFTQANGEEISFFTIINIADEMFYLFFIKLAINLIGFIATFQFWRLAEKRDFEEKQ